MIEWNNLDYNQQRALRARLTYLIETVSKLDNNGIFLDYLNMVSITPDFMFIPEINLVYEKIIVEYTNCAYIIFINYLGKDNSVSIGIFQHHNDFDGLKYVYDFKLDELYSKEEKEKYFKNVNDGPDIEFILSLLFNIVKKYN